MQALDPYKQAVVVGVAELNEPLRPSLESCSSELELMVKAAQGACADTGITEEIKTQLDVIAVVRTVADTSPIYTSPFKPVMNYPRALARRIGASPSLAIYSEAGGNTPQQLVNEFSERIARGENLTVLLVGGEALKTSKAALKAGVQLNKGDDTNGQLEDRGHGLDSIFDRQQVDNGLLTAPPLYGLVENARRHRLGMDANDYALHMARLLEPFSHVAARHPASAVSIASSAHEIANPSANNPMIANPYTRHMVAKDGVNQSAAVILTTLARARSMGIASDRLVYSIGGGHVADCALLERPDLSRSAAMRLAYQAALDAYGISVKDITTMDLYSCFPVAVFAACDALGVNAFGDTALTLTGGLPFFGGPGNNYAMHSIVNISKRLRKRPAGIGLVGANGGVLSKHAVGLYATQAAERGWQACDNRALQMQVNGQLRPQVDHAATGEATIESYSLGYRHGTPQTAYIIGRTRENKRFLARSQNEDRRTLARMLKQEPIGAKVRLSNAYPGTYFSFVD